METKNNIKIIADYREKPSRIPEKLLQNNIELSVVSLAAGDYLINNQVIVERKSAEDFIQSIINNRLFDQCSRLKKTRLHSIILIEGNPYQTKHNINRQAIRGAIVSILISWQIPLILSKNTEDSVEILTLIGRQVIKENYSVPLITGYKPRRIKSRKIQFLQGLPTIGPRLANRLYNTFGSIESIIVAPARELAKVKGIGKKKAGSMKEFINGN